MSRPPRFAVVQSSEAVAGDTLRNLIRQFSQELCFYRELVQNSIDAGSTRIDVDVTYDDERRVAVASVIDYGDGMDREIIDHQLTRLFSSSKEDDLTKIGKFGIGFVSVFSVGPEAVVVDTGRAGESWRVLFHADGSFERIVRDEPMDGTQVRLYLAMPRRDLEDFVRRSRETLLYWCRHTQVELRFQGERVNEPFELPGRLSIHHEASGTELVAALTVDDPPFFGFYNQGLTLLEGRREYFKGVAFKLRSRHLEHTLTRDNVREDESFSRAMAVVAHQVRHRLLPALFEALAAAVRDGTSADDLWELAVPHLEREWAHAGGDAAIIPLLTGPPMRYCDLADAYRRTASLLTALGRKEDARVLLWEVESSPLVETLGRRGIPVLAGAHDAFMREAQRQRWPCVRASEILCQPRVLEEDEVDPAMARLARDVEALLTEADLPVTGMVQVEMGPDCCSTPFLVQEERDPLVLRSHTSLLQEDGLPRPWPLNLLGRPWLLFGVDHPLVLKLASLPGGGRMAAAYFLAKLACLADGLHPQMDARLLACALARREVSARNGG